MRKIVVFGLGPMFRGGIAHYTQSLAGALAQHPGTEVNIVSWLQPYPVFIPRDFTDPAPDNELVPQVPVHYITNFNSYQSWNETFKHIQFLAPDMIIFEWFTPIQSLPVAHIARQLRRKTSIKVVFDLHYIHSVRHTSLAAHMVRRTLQYAHHYIVHSFKAACDLKELFPATSFTLTENIMPVMDGTTKLILQLFHPNYQFLVPETMPDVAALKQELHLRRHVFLFFGSISRYKGLHHVIDAFAALARKYDDVSLLIVGESSWQLAPSQQNVRFRHQLLSLAKKLFLSEADDEKDYHPLQRIEALGIQDSVTVVNRYVPNQEVARYFAVADYVMLYYEAANGSGVEAVANAFGVPVLCTRVGHFPESVQDGVNGYIAEVDNLTSMVNTMVKAVEHPIDKQHAHTAAQSFTWQRYAEAVSRIVPVKEQRPSAPAPHAATAL